MPKESKRKENTQEIPKNIFGMLSQLSENFVTEKDFEEAIKLILETIKKSKFENEEARANLETQMQAMLETANKNFATAVKQANSFVDTFKAETQDWKDAQERLITDELQKTDVMFLDFTSDVNERFEDFEREMLDMIPVFEEEQPEIIRNKLELLRGEDRLDVSAIKGLEELMQERVDGIQFPNMAGTVHQTRVKEDGTLIYDQGIRFFNFTGSGVSTTYDGNGQATITITGGGAGGSKHVIQEEGVDLAARTNLNFIGPTVTAADDAGNNATTVTVDDDLSAYDNTTSLFVAQGDNVTVLDGTADRLLYVNSSGDVTELALGANGTYLQSQGTTSAPTWSTPAGSGDVSKVGTPVDNQIGVWTGDGTIEGDADLTWNGNLLAISGDSSQGVLEAERTNAATADVLGAVKVKATSAGNMADGFGAAFQFYIEDNAATENYIADIRGVRDGADNSGYLSVHLTNAGVTNEHLRIEKEGVLSVFGTATTAASLDLYEDTDNGTNRVRLQSPASVTSDRTLTLPDATGTILHNGDIGSTVQAYDADLDTWATLTPSANAQSLVTAANYAAMRALLDLEAGTDFYSIAAADAAFQPLDAGLTSIAGLTTAADRMIYTTASDTYAVATLTSFARTLLDDTTQATARTTLGLGTGNSPQFTAINLGNASDTTLARIAAGRVSIEGVEIATLTGTQTLTNKTLGATTLSGAITAADNDITGIGQLDYDFATGAVSALGNLGATEAIDWSTATHFTGTLDANVTITHTSEGTGQSITLLLSYSGAQRTITWSDVDKWMGGSAPSAPSAAGEVLVVKLLFDGTTCYGSAEIAS